MKRYFLTFLNIPNKTTIVLFKGYLKGYTTERNEGQLKDYCYGKGFANRLFTTDQETTRKDHKIWSMSS